jgi:hypothetical protein
VQERIRLASGQYQEDLDVAAICKTVMETFHALCTWSAYAVAEARATGGSLLESVPGDLDRRMLGASWEAVADGLRALPPADEPAPRAELDERARAIGEALESWLQHIGFTYRDMPDGTQHFGVENPEEWWLLTRSLSE